MNTAVPGVREVGDDEVGRVTLRLRELIEMPDLRLEVTAAGDLDVLLTGVFTTDLLTPGRYLDGGELVLSSLMWRRTCADSEAFVRHLVEHRVAALAAGTAPGPVPPDLTDACRRYALPLLVVVPEVSFGTISERVFLGLRADELGRPTDGDRASLRWRRMVSAVAGGEGVGQLLRETEADIGVPCTLLTSTGRVVAGPTPADAREPDMIATSTASSTEPTEVDRLVAAYFGASQLPWTVRGRSVWTVMGVGGPGPRITGWFLAAPTGAADLSPRQEDALHDLADAVDLERSWLDQGARVERRLADRLLGLIDQGTAGQPELEVARHASGLAADAPLVAVSAVRPRAAAGNEPEDGTSAETLRQLVEDALLHVVSAPVVAVGDGGEVLALAPVPDGDLESLIAAMRTATDRLVRGLARVRLAVGISGLSSSGARAGGSLRGLAEEARQARQVAERATERGGTRISVMTRNELDSHVVLLAALPAQVRSGYHERLLSPLLNYDASHRTELMRTLQVFLDLSGAWSQAAQQLHLHVNTLRYRIGRIEQLTGRDLNRLEHQVDLFLALRARG